MLQTNCKFYTSKFAAANAAGCSACWGMHISDVSESLLKNLFFQMLLGCSERMVCSKRIVPLVFVSTRRLS